MTFGSITLSPSPPLPLSSSLFVSLPLFPSLFILSLPLFLSLYLFPSRFFLPSPLLSSLPPLSLFLTLPSLSPLPLSFSPRFYSLPSPFFSCPFSHTLLSPSPLLFSSLSSIYLFHAFHPLCRPPFFSLLPLPPYPLLFFPTSFFSFPLIPSPAPPPLHSPQSPPLSPSPPSP